MKCNSVAKLLVLLAFALNSQVADAQMFKNAIRTDARQGEGAGIASLHIASANGGFFSCTAFFVKNSGNRPLLMTARHCSAFKLAKSCEAGMVTLTTQEGSFKGTCSRSLIENKELDETLIEGNFANWETEVLPKIRFYSLSSQRPEFGTRLEVLGYPADFMRHSQFTVTRNCWVSGQRMVTVDDYPGQSAALTKSFYAEWAAKKVKINSPSAGVQVTEASGGKSQLSYLKHRMAAFHNCSVYGGNSGGPITIEGTTTVLGLPTSFFPDARTVQPETLSTSMDTTADFVAKNERKLRSLGVDVVAPYPQGSYVPPYRYAVDPYYRISRCFRTVDLAAGGAQAVDNSWCDQ